MKEVKEAILHLLNELSHVNRELGYGYKHGGDAYDVNQQEDYAVRWARTLVIERVGATEDKDAFLFHSLESYEDSVTELQAVRTEVDRAARGEDSLGEEIYDRLMADPTKSGIFEGDPSRYVNSRLLGEIAEELSIDKQEAAYLKAFLRRRIRVVS